MSQSRIPIRYLLSRFASRRWQQFSGASCLLLCSLFFGRVPALVIGVTLDSVLLTDQTFSVPLVPTNWVPSTTAGQAGLIVGALGSAIVAESATRWYGGLVYERATLWPLHEIRTTAYESATALSMTFHDTTETDLLSVLNDDIDNLDDLFAGLRDGFLYGGELCSAFVVMLALNWNLALVVAVLPVCIAATGRVYATLLEPRYDAVRKSVGTMNLRLRDAIEGIRTVKAFTGEEREYARVASASGEYKSAKWSAIRLRAVYNRVSWPIAAVGIWGLFALGSYWIIAGPPLGFTHPLSPGTLLTFILYTFSFLDPTRRLAVDVVDRLESAGASSRRVVPLLRSDERIGDRTSPELVVENGRIEYDGVSFSYATAEGQTLTDLSFTAEGGALVGIVGSTGAGKSTLLKLLFRFYEPDSGTVRIDGQDIATVSVGSLRQAIGYVGQDPFVFPGTVHENVAYATPETTREAVIAAAKRANAHEFVRDLENGYDTRVGERGVTLSGGQRQRLAIARALLGDPPILVFDEATSHVDTATEADIQRQLRSVAGDRTVFAIAHRLSTIRGADQVVVLDEGRLVEEGTHDELVGADGTYATLWRVQTGEIAAAERTDGVEQGARG